MNVFDVVFYDNFSTFQRDEIVIRSKKSILFENHHQNMVIFGDDVEAVFGRRKKNTTKE